jgi:hypothetical protein
MYEKYPIFFMVARLRKKTFFRLTFPFIPAVFFYSLGLATGPGKAGAEIFSGT